MEWISVDERLPEVKESGNSLYPRSDEVLVYVERPDGCGIRYVGRLYELGVTRIWDSGNYDNGEVTHWMPLPQPPEGEEAA